MINKIIILFWLSAVLMTAGYRNSLALERVVKLKSHYNVKVCGNDRDKDILVTVGMGAISSQDQFFAFDILIKYNPEKVRFDGPVYLNTFAEFIPMYKNVSVAHETGYIRAFGYSDKALSGDREIIGFVAKYLDDCQSYVEFEIIDFDLTDDFKGKYVVDSSLVFIPERVVDPDKKVEVNLDNEILKFDDTKVLSSKLNVKMNPTTDSEKMFFEIYLDEEKPFTISSVNAISDKISITEFSKIADSKYTLLINLFDYITDEDIIEFTFEEKFKDTVDVETRFTVNPGKFEGCYCYSDFTGDEIKLLSVGEPVDSSVSVRSYFDTKINVNINDGMLNIRNNSGYKIIEVELYDLLGNRVKSLNVNSYSEVLNFSIEFLKSGFYLIKIKTTKREVNKSIIIYN
ncbi:MAG: T9SS type A sorting domain-containing protein [Candidatus Kapabacteria bacterium]|nr:T9SS type A sorting domain-containing protein [Ignavibacteriota bacterium]MCW5884310.1 T9SS type A sorting domain-containing protein [Candidatus Kapabacteria bacterium]